MSEAIIQVENLGKSYRIQHQQRERYTALRDVIASKVRGLFAKAAPSINQTQSEEDFWAVNDISFDIKAGETVGIIGRNGAGKSTLLKLLSRITAPTRGRITLRGRVASLLEVGTGFHPELTGRENIFLNGAILGMTRAEMRAKFDEIVAFAEIEKFLDTPVKRYSSGMYVRLAFAVAAHLDPEILIVDEVLAVGDAQFQKKCIGKMQSVGDKGRTVIFVTHQFGVLSKLCERTIHLRQGKVADDGPTTDVVTEYLSFLESNGDWWEREAQCVGSQIFIYRMQTQKNGKHCCEFGLNEEIHLEIEIKTVGNVADAKLGVTIQDQQTNFISTVVASVKQFSRQGSLVLAHLVVPSSILAPNKYSFRVALFEGKLSPLDVVESACSFRVIDTGSSMAQFEGLNYGSVIIPFRWEASSKSQEVLSRLKN